VRGKRGEPPARKQEEDKEEVVEEVIRPVEKVIESVPWFTIMSFALGGMQVGFSLFVQVANTGKTEAYI
jgi:hypothetical protein